MDDYSSCHFRIALFARTVPRRVLQFYSSACSFFSFEHITSNAFFVLYRAHLYHMSFFPIHCLSTSTPNLVSYILFLPGSFIVLSHRYLCGSQRPSSRYFSILLSWIPSDAVSRLAPTSLTKKTATCLIETAVSNSLQNTINDTRKINNTYTNSNTRTINNTPSSLPPPLVFTSSTYHLKTYLLCACNHTTPDLFIMHLLSPNCTPARFIIHLLSPNCTHASALFHFVPIPP